MKMKGIKITLLLTLSMLAIALMGIGCSSGNNLIGNPQFSGSPGDVSNVFESSSESFAPSTSSVSSTPSESSEGIESSEESSSSSSMQESSEESSNSSSIQESSEDSTISSSVEESSEEESSSQVVEDDESSSSVSLPHIHNYNAYVVREPDCELMGIVRYTCHCGNTYTETYEALGHMPVRDFGTPSTCVKHGVSEGSHCARCEKVLIEQVQLDLAEHTYQRGYCSVCNLTGLEFEIDRTQGYVVCTGYVCDWGDVRRVEIPDTYCGYPVRALAAHLFENCKDLYSVELGENVEIIGEGAFEGCYHLAEIYDRSKAQVSKYTSLKNGALTNYAEDDDIHYEPFESEIEVIDEFVVHHDGEESILLTYLGTKKSISIPEGVTRLATYSLWEYEIVEVVIPESVHYIEKWAFYLCNKLERVQFLDPDNWEAKGHVHINCDEKEVDNYEENILNWTAFAPGHLSTPEDGKKAIIDLYNAADWRKTK